MTDQELIHKAAEGVMGWKLLDLTSTDYPSGPHWQTEYSYIPLHEWDPVLNPRDWLLVLEKMRELGWCGSLTWWDSESDPLFCVQFYRFDTNEDGPEIFQENIGRAICLAAIQVL